MSHDFDRPFRGSLGAIVFFRLLLSRSDGMYRDSAFDVDLTSFVSDALSLCTGHRFRLTSCGGCDMRSHSMSGPARFLDGDRAPESSPEAPREKRLVQHARMKHSVPEVGDFGTPREDASVAVLPLRLSLSGVGGRASQEDSLGHSRFPLSGSLSLHFGNSGLSAIPILGIGGVGKPTPRRVANKYVCTGSALLSPVSRPAGLALVVVVRLLSCRLLSSGAARCGGGVLGSIFSLFPEGFQVMVA